MSKHLTLGILLAVLPLGATAEAQQEAKPPRVLRTIEMDPETPQEFRGWWVAEDALILIDAGGGYQLWEGTDRFATPVEMGRWHQRNHAVVLLESYAIPRRPASRLSMWIKGKELMADRQKPGASLSSTAFRKVSLPPVAPEDALIGIWEGPGGELHLNPDLSYLWRAPADAPAIPASLASQRGEWSFRNNQLRMVPLARRQVPVVEAVMMDEKKQITAMQTAHGQLKPLVDPAILAKPNEPSSTPENQSSGAN